MKKNLLLFTFKMTWPPESSEASYLPVLTVLECIRGSELARFNMPNASWLSPRQKTIRCLLSSQVLQKQLFNKAEPQLLKALLLDLAITSSLLLLRRLVWRYMRRESLPILELPLAALS
jgi:hypothetical protein